MRRLKSWIIGSAILLGAVVVAFLLVAGRPEPPIRETPSVLPVAVVVPLAEGDGGIPVRGAGTVVPTAEVVVAAEVGGRVVWVNPAFLGGGRIDKGEPLVRIDRGSFETRVEQARAAVTIAEVDLLKIQEEARVARMEYERFRQHRPGELADGAPNALAMWEPQVKASEAVLARERAALREAERNLRHTEVRAPFNGIVRSEDVAVGRFLAPGEGIGTLYATSSVEIPVSLSDNDVALLPELWRLQAGQANRRLTASVSSRFGGSTYTWEGYVDRVEAALDPETRTTDIVVRVPRPFDSRGENGTPPLMIGKFVDVALEGAEIDGWFTVPAGAVRTDGEIWVVDDGSVRLVPVGILQRDDDTVFVTGDLAAGMDVVTGGLTFATEGMAVRTTGPAE